MYQGKSSRIVAGAGGCRLIGQAATLAFDLPDNA
jgi:hypothetical protein